MHHLNRNSAHALLLVAMLGSTVLATSPLSASPAVDGIWSQPALTVSPPSRGGGRLLYDSNRHRAVLFGGYSVNETWVLDLDNPTTWELLPVRGALPLPRGETNAVYDPVNDRLWIWGGRHGSGAVYGEPAYLQFTNVPGDSATWVRVNPDRDPTNGDQPTPRYGSGTVYDPAGQRMIFYGGGYGNANLMTSGTWALSLDARPTWDLLPMTSPYPYGGCFSNLSIDPQLNRLVLHFTVAATNWWQFPVSFSQDIYTAPLDGSTGWVLTPATGSDSLQYYGRESCYHPLQDRIISLSDTYLGRLYGGPPLPGVWDFQTASGTWRHLYPSGPVGPPSADDIIYDPMNDRMIVIRAAGPSTQPMETWFLSWIGLSAVKDPSTSPPILQAGVARPNPFVESVLIPLELRDASILGAMVFDGLGRTVRDLGSMQRPSGAGELTWDGRNNRGQPVSPGVYFVRLATVDGQGTSTVRVTRVR